MPGSKSLRADILLFLAAFVWGGAFVAQRWGMQHVGPFTFNAMRFCLGGVLVLLFWFFSGGKIQVIKNLLQNPMHLRWVIIISILVFGGATFQQIGLQYSTVSKAGFLTALYVPIVPCLGLLRGKNVTNTEWLAVSLATLGAFFLSVTGDFTIAFGDLLLILNALFWALHLQALNVATKLIDTVLLAAIQFIICAVLSLIAAIICEVTTLSAIYSAQYSILYAGGLSIGIGYTLQVVAQKYAPPTHTAIIMSLESVFAAIFGYLLIGEILTSRAWFGCSLVLAAVIVSQLRKNE